MVALKLLVISDVHANIDALRAVEKAEPNTDLTVFAGDFVDVGFHAREVLEWFADRPHFAVRGNHDDDLIRAYAESERQPLMHESSPLMRNINLLTDAAVEWLAACPTDLSFKADGISYYMRHYDPSDPGAGERPERFDALWEMSGLSDGGRRRVILGHTHLLRVVDCGGGRVLLNPGSLSFRKGADAKNTGGDYIVIEDGQIFSRHVDYPTAHLRKLLAESDFPQFFVKTAMIYYSSRVD